MNTTATDIDAETGENFGTYPTPSMVHLERILPGPIERVWAYLIEADKRAKWFASGSMPSAVGEGFQLLFNNQTLGKSGDTPERFRKYENKTMSSVLTRYEPPHALGFTFGIGPDSSEVLFELSPHARGVLLTVKHWKLTTGEGKLSVSAGWHAHLGVLVDLLEGNPERPFWPRFEALEREYRKLIPGLS
ncbi:MAG TPA: SRPBCC family protein [Rhodocyclaceae bacterium]|nr:SRPBCC family protein [Rhodocyclaceae bacterium]